MDAESVSDLSEKFGSVNLSSMGQGTNGLSSQLTEAISVIKRGMQADTFDPDLVVDQLTLIQSSIDDAETKAKIGHLIDHVQRATVPISDPSDLLVAALSATQTNVDVDIQSPPDDLFPDSARQVSQL